MKRLLILLALLGGISAGAQTITLNDAVNSGCIISATNPCPRAGINLGQPSGAFPQFKNLLQFSNPGFEPQQVQQIFQFAVNPCTFCSTTTFQWNVSNTNFTNYDANQWTGATFTVIAGCYSTMTGCTGGGTSDPAYGCTGTIASNTVATGGFGSQFTTSAACPGPLGIPGQVIVIGTNSSMANVGPPSTVGWPQGTETGSVTAENTDLCAGCGTQSVEFNGASSMTLSNTAYATLGALKTITMNGNYTVKFWAKSKSGSLTALTFTLTTRNGNCANPSPCTYTPTLTTSWAQYSHTFALTETPSPTNAFSAGISFAVSAGADILFDNMEFDDPSTNPTAFEDSFVNALKAWCQSTQNTTGPGCTLRYGPSPDSETMANWTKSVFLASPSTEAANSNNVKFVQNTGYFTQKVRIYDFLQLCQQVGAIPVLIIPLTLTTTDAANLVDYLEDNTGGTTYGAIRQAQGQSTAWVGQAGSPFPVIYLEYGNENWNGLFLGHALFSHTNNPNNYYDYALRGGVVNAAARARQVAQSYNQNVTKWAANGQTGSTTDFQYLTAFWCGQPGYSGGAITCTQGGEDVIEYQQYYAASTIGSVSTTGCLTGGSNNASCPLYGPTLTETWSDWYDPSSTSGAAQSGAKIPTITACGPSHNAACQAATYERAIYPTGSGTFTQAVSDTFTQTGWHGVADAISYAESDHNNMAYIDEYATESYALSQGGVNVHIYGAFIDNGGDTSVTNAALFGGSYTPRPQMGAAQVYNYCKIGQEVTATGASIPTYNLAANSNSVHTINSVPNLTFHEYKNGTQRCLLISNNDIFNPYTVSLAGTNVPTTVTQYQLAPSSPTATNESANLSSTSTVAATVYPVLTPSVNVSGGFTAPPTSTTALLFSTAATPLVTVDLNSRSGGTTIPANLMGTGVAAISASSPLNLLVAPSLHHVRLFVDINQNCPAGTCGTWSIPKAQLALLVAGDPNVRVLIAVDNTPSNLGATTCTPPSNASTWAGYVNTGLAALAVSNPGVVDAVEIWNEPDGNTTWCPAGGATNDLSTYKTFVATVGPAIKSANPTLKVGMPALASPGPNTAAWFGTGGVLSAWATPDFISYHLYLGASWASWPSLLAQMQNTGSGNGFYYHNVQSTLAGQGYSGEIWITEQNDSYSFGVSDCCRYDATFSPVYNSLSAIDYLNAVNTYSATTLPSRFYLFNDESSAAKGFCLWGNIAAADCSNAAPEAPYPPYYAYVLLNSLGLPKGGNVASSISPASTTAGVSCSAFYTTSGDSLLCVNPTSTDQTSQPITINNTGLGSPTATQYLLNASNPTITSSPLSLTSAGGTSYTATVTIPANSTLGIQIQPPIPAMGRSFTLIP